MVKLCRPMASMMSREELAKRSYVIIDKEGVIRYLNIRPCNSEKDLSLDRSNC